MNNKEIETQSKSYLDAETLSELELLQLNYNTEISNNFNLRDDLIKLKLEIIKSHALLLESKKETLDREKIILEYNLQQNKINHQEFKNKQRELLEHISNNHPTINGNWSFDKKTGKIIES